MKERSSEYKLLTGLFFRLLPYQVLLLIITSINGMIDGLYASNKIGESAMTAIGPFWSKASRICRCSISI